MPARIKAKGPGEFIRDHLTDAPENRDYVGAMYQAYKAHVRGAGYRAPGRLSFHKYVWYLNQTGALVFDGAEPSGWDGAPPPPPGYSPTCASPAPRHYYRMVDPDHLAFRGPEAAWRQQQGLPGRPVPPPVTLPPVITRLTPTP